MGMNNNNVTSFEEMADEQEVKVEATATETAKPAENNTTEKTE